MMAVLFDGPLKFACLTLGLSSCKVRSQRRIVPGAVCKMSLEAETNKQS